MGTTYRYLPGAAAARKLQPPILNPRLKLLSAVNSMPPLPAVLDRLLKMLSDDSVSAAQVAATIERDSVLSGSVLRCVNSAYYSLPARVSSIRHAVTLLGFATVRNLALAFSMRRVMAQGAISRPRYAAYAKHSLACALMTQFLALYTRSRDLDGAFAAGLFHDVGKLLVFNTLPELAPKIVSLCEDTGSYLEAERQVLDVTHCELSEIVLESWKLPEPIRQAARYHHEPDLSPGDAEGASLAELVSAANGAVKRLGYAALPVPCDSAASPERAFEALQLQEHLPEILEKFQTEFEGIESAFA